MAMKKMLLSTLVFATITTFASAQTRSTSRSANKKHVTTAAYNGKKTATKNSASTTTKQPDNRKEYVKDGQLATPTGHQATPINSDQYQSPRDSSSKKKKKQ